jgi:dihydropteroate synthase
MPWQIRNHTLDVSKRCLVMGVLNVTPDSFSDGGLWHDSDAAVRHGLEMEEAGADILDIGGESTRPGATPVSLEEELRRVLPVIESLAKKTSALLSIDTQKPEVAEAALGAGASIVNDIGGLRHPKMRELLRRSRAGAVAMHMRETPATMQRAPEYTNVCEEVSQFLSETLSLCQEDGVSLEQIVIDPGIGFGKTVAHNLSLLKELASFHSLERPILLGISRKSFLGALQNSASMEDRLWPTVALSCYARSLGVAILRVHDVAANCEAIRSTETLLEACA